MGKTIRGFNGQPSEPDYPLPADLPFSVAPTQDNGARALEGRLAVVYGNGDGPPLRDHEYGAAAILANGAVFLPDAAELDRLRRIEAAARDVDAMWSGEDGEIIQWLVETPEVLDDLRAALAARGWRLVPSAETSSAYLLGYEAARAAPSPEPLPREALEAMRQVHARHDLGHKVGAWANACALCEAYRSVAALSPDRPTPQ